MSSSNRSPPFSACNMTGSSRTDRIEAYLKGLDKVLEQGPATATEGGTSGAIQASSNNTVVANLSSLPSQFTRNDTETETASSTGCFGGSTFPGFGNTSSKNTAPSTTHSTTSTRRAPSTAGTEATITAV